VHVGYATLEPPGIAAARNFSSVVFEMAASFTKEMCRQHLFSRLVFVLEPACIAQGSARPRNALLEHQQTARALDYGDATDR